MACMGQGCWRGGVSEPGLGVCAGVCTRGDGWVCTGVLQSGSPPPKMLVTQLNKLWGRAGVVAAPCPCRAGLRPTWVREDQPGWVPQDGARAGWPGGFCS